jgi:hypothetical protein
MIGSAGEKHGLRMLAELIDAGARHCVLACIGMPSAQWVADEIIRPVRAMTGYDR